MLLFRIAQEALNNVRRHAVATAVVIKLSLESNIVRMTISDNGKGFASTKKVADSAGKESLGILGMYERAQLLGGTLKVESAPGKGTSVIIEFPLAGRKLSRDLPG